MNYCRLVKWRLERHVLRNLYLTLTLIFALGGVASQLKAADVLQLEKRLWLTEGEDLPALESAIVREIQRNPQSVHHHYLLTNVYLRRFLLNPRQNKLFEQAMQLARQTVALDANAELGYLALADIYDVVDRGQEAQEVFRVFTYRSTIKRSWRYYLAKAKIFLSESTLDNSLKLLQKALHSKGVLHEVVIPYVIVLIDAKHVGNRDGLIAALEHWRTKTPHRLFDKYLATLHMNEQGYQKAWQLYGDLLRHDPHNHELRRNKAIIAYMYMGKEEEAQQEFIDLLASTKNSSQLEISIINTHLGIIYMRRNHEAQAQQAFLAAITNYTDNDMLLELIVKAYQSEAKFHQLADFLEELNIIVPGNAVYYGLLGDVLTEYLGDYQRAAIAYEDAIVLDPHNSRLYSALGMARYRLREFEQALQMFGKARSLDSLDATAFYNEACVYALLSRNAEAIYSLQKAIELDASLREHAREDSDFDKIRTLPAFMNVVN